jgi:4-hydroxybenzoyl-CoA thioesterase
MHFRRRYRWRFGDIDAAGIAYYPSFFHYFHAAFEDWWSDGIGEAYADVMGRDHFGLPAVRIECDFLAPVRYGDEPEIALGVLALGASSVRLGFWIESAGSLRTRAEIVTVSVDLRTMAKRPIPAVRRAQLARFQLGAGEFPPPPRP